MSAVTLTRACKPLSNSACQASGGDDADLASNLCLDLSQTKLVVLREMCKESGAHMYVVPAKVWGLSEQSLSLRMSLKTTGTKQELADRVAEKQKAGNSSA